MLLKLITFLLPWPLKRKALNSWFGYQVHPQARIGFSWIYPGMLIMEEEAQIGHLSVAVNLDRIEMRKASTIGRGNWITGFSTKVQSLHFQHQVDRKAELFIGESSAITKNHHIDCTNLIHIGKFVTVAGYNSQLLTHSINIYENYQDSNPIYIGDYTFIGTNVAILGGAVLPAYSVLGAKSLLNKSFNEEWMIYGGVPAKPILKLSKDAKYFSRTDGFVY